MDTYIIKQHFSFQGSPNYTQIENFGMKVYNLATLEASGLLLLDLQ
jgi:hypothetical protein